MDTKISKIHTGTLTQQVVGLLKQRILDGKLMSGQRVWATDLAQEFGVSLIPVKDALLILQGEGLIINVPRRGSIVRQFSLRDVHELIHIRQLIEIDAVALIIKNGAVTRELIHDLTRHNKTIGERRSTDGTFMDRAIPFEHDHEFHALMVGACGNRLLTEWYERLNSQAQVIRLSFWNIGPRGDKTYREHAAIIEGLARQDLPASRRAIRAHLDSVIADFNHKIKSEEMELKSQGHPALPEGRRNRKKNT